MDFEDNQTPESMPPAPDFSDNQPTAPNIPNIARPPKRSGWRIFWGIVLALSIMANLFLIIMLIAVAAFSFAGQQDIFNESMIAKGTGANKIAVIRIEGIINEQLSSEIQKQMKLAREDKRVKAVILRTITPGGGVSASDRIHNEIKKFREETGKPVVAFMQTVAASGGYYTSVACNKIVAEPTTITGSIGVMLNYLVVKELLEKKLGISPVVVKSGPRKNWPSIFDEVTDEQIAYLHEKLIDPAYDRFVQLVAEGRDALTEEQVRILADGSIYPASEALQNNLIDQIGYFDEAVAVAQELANIENAKVIEYERPFTLSSLLGSQTKSLWNIDRNTLQELAMPQLMYLWDASW